MRGGKLSSLNLPRGREVRRLSFMLSLVRHAAREKMPNGTLLIWLCSMFIDCKTKRKKTYVITSWLIDVLEIAQLFWDRWQNYSKVWKRYIQTKSSFDNAILKQINIYKYRKRWSNTTNRGSSYRLFYVNYVWKKAAFKFLILYSNYNKNTHFLSTHDADLTFSFLVTPQFYCI